MRSFISLNIDIKNKENIQIIQNLLKTKIDKPIFVRFENPKNFHLTVFFIGEIDESKIPEIYSGLKKVVENKFGELNFNCNEINAFPDLKNPRVLFLNCTNEEGKIFDLAEEIKNVMKDFGFVPDKNFHPHITLARVMGRVKLKDLSDIKIDINFSVTKLSIMQSRITTKGAEHKEMFTINL